MTDLDAVDATPRSPQQRRLTSLGTDRAATWSRTTCRAAIPPATDVDLARGTEIVRALLAGTGHADDEPVGISAVDGVLTVDLPASCADAVTAVAVVREILDLDPPADALPHSAAARWWHEMSGAPDAGALREFWRARAAGWSGDVPPLLGGPDTRGAPPADVPAEVGDHPAAWLLAAWQVLLRRHSGLDELVVGVATDLRRHDELRGCRGPLTAYLPVRSRLPLTASMAEHAAAANQDVAEGAARGEWFDWARALGDPSAAGRPLAFGFSWVEPAAPVTDLRSGGDAFALALHCQRGPDGVRAHLEYDPRAVSAEVATDLAAELGVLVQADPDTPGAAVSLATKEIDDRLRTWGTGASGPLPAGGLLDLVRATAARTPDATAVRGSTPVTYAELVSRVDILATALCERSMPAEAVVAVRVPPGPDLLVALLGVLRAGGAYLLLDPALPEARAAALTSAAQARLTITERGSAPSPATVPVDAAPTGAPATPPAVPLDALAYVLHTSGSTGTPKGVQVTHRGLVNYLTGIAADWPVGCHSLVATAPAFDLALPALFLPLVSGGSVTFAGPGPIEPAALLADLAAHHYDLVRATPAQVRTWHTELVNGTGSIPADTVIAVGGEPFPAALARDWSRAGGPRLLNYYGPTETVGARTHGPADAAAAGPSGTIPLGTPIPNTTVRVLDADLRPCPLGVTGELVIGGAGLARGYAGRPGDTAAKFVPDPDGPPGARRYRTGDLARWLPGRRLEFIGRQDDQVKVRGYRVEPGEVAAALADHPGVRDVAVVGQEAPDGHTVLVAYAVATGEPVPVDALRTHASRVLPDHMLPASAVWLAELPLSTNGKLDRSALPEPGDERPEQTVEYVAPSTDVERVLAEVWAETLGLDRVGVHDNFFAIGGDSILSILVASRAAKRGLTLSLRDFFDHQTIATMAPHTQQRAAAVAVRSAERALTPVQQWFFDQDQPHPGHWNQGWLLAIDGEPDLPALAAAVTAVTRHHPALSSRFEPGEHGWRPVRGTDVPDGTFRHLVLDGTDWPATLSAALAGLQEFDIATGPLLRVALLDGGPGRRRLSLTAHHLVVDTVSWQIVFADLDTAYRQAVEGRPIALPATTMPPDEWGAVLRDAVERAAPDLDFWLAQSPPDRAPLPVDHDAGPIRAADADVRTVVLDAGRTERLLRTMSADVRVDHVLTAAVALAVAEWTGVPSLHLTVEGHGRGQELAPGAELHRSVGWFTALAPMLVRLPAGPSLDALRAVRDQLTAMPGDGVGYGVLRFLDPVSGPRLAELPVPQVSVNYIGATGGQAGDPGGLAVAPAPEPLPRLVHPESVTSRLWTINAAVQEGRLRVDLGYAGRHYESTTADRVADRVLRNLADLVDAWAETGGGLDRFPLLRADKPVLDRVLAKALARAPRRPAPESATESSAGTP